MARIGGTRTVNDRERKRNFARNPADRFSPLRAHFGVFAMDAQQIFLTGPQVQRRYQKSHVTIWRWTRDLAPAFPQPIQINGRNYWRLADLEAWEAAQATKSAA
jgi:predicted DNA-binding transcriptional regulator AlpA